MITTDTCITIVVDGVTKKDPDVVYVKACDEIDITTTTAIVAVDTPPLPETGYNTAASFSMGFFFGLFGACMIALARRR